MKNRMLLLPLLLLVSAAAAAHAKLDYSSPAEKSRVTAPKELTMGFTDPVVITSLTLQRGADAAKPLKLPASKQTEPGFTIPLPALTPGDYVVTWKVETDDTHAASGMIHFTVVAAPAEAREK